MSALSIEVPFPVFQDRDGQPLDNGYIWLGVANLNPQTNPVVAYFDAALTIVAPQPLRTINGYVSRAGTPAQIYVDGVNFSILVQDSKGTMVYNFPDGTGISPEQTVSVKDFGAVGDGVTDDGLAVQAAYAAAKNIGWPAGIYRLGQYIRVYADTRTTFDEGVVIERAAFSGPVFCNADAGDSTTTAYNGDGNISFIGPVEVRVAAGNPSTSLQVYGFVHAKGFYIDGQGGAYVHGFTNRHAIEINACAEWTIKGYKFADQNVGLGDVNLAEVIQWDGAFDSGRFPFAPGASDNTTCQDFEISGCTFDDIFTAYGAHHAPNFKHPRAHIFNNTILNAKSPETAERLRHLKDSILYGNIIINSAGRASNIRQCINVLQDGYIIVDTGSPTSSVFWQTSENCVWGPNNRIQYTGTPPLRPFEVGSIGNPSTGIVINRGIVDFGSVTPTASSSNLLSDNGINTSFAGANISYKPFIIDGSGLGTASPPALFLKDFSPSEGEIAVTTGENLSLGQYDEVTNTYVSVIEVSGANRNLSIMNTGGQGNLIVQTPGAGIELTTPDGTKRYSITVDNAGAIVSTLV
jgi:hypothetical protein